MKKASKEFIDLWIIIASTIMMMIALIQEWVN